MIRNNVDFPEPDLPSKATISPSWSLKLTSSNTKSSWEDAFLNDFRQFSIDQHAHRFEPSIPLLQSLKNLPRVFHKQRGWRKKLTFNFTDDVSAFWVDTNHLGITTLFFKHEMSFNFWVFW